MGVPKRKIAISPSCIRLKSQEEVFFTIGLISQESITCQTTGNHVTKIEFDVCMLILSNEKKKKISQESITCQTNHVTKTEFDVCMLILSNEKKKKKCQDHMSTKTTMMRA